MTTLYFAAACLGDGSTPRLLCVEPTTLVIAGWTGRNSAAIEHHIQELEALGVPRPSTVPLYYRVSHQQLTQSEVVQALGAESSGEAEPVLFFTQGEWWLTVGSDHTDRQVETYSVAVSKQMCAKPVAQVAWRWADVVARQDELHLRSSIWENGACTVFPDTRAQMQFILTGHNIGPSPGHLGHGLGAHLLGHSHRIGFHLTIGVIGPHRQPPLALSKKQYRLSLA